MTVLALVSAKTNTSMAASATFFRALGVGFSGSNTETVEESTQIIFRTAGVLSMLGAHITTNSRGASTYKSRINGADGTQTFSVGSSATGYFSDATHTDTISAGDKVCATVTTGAGGSSFIEQQVTSLFAATTDSAVPWIAQGTASIVDTVPRYAGWGRDLIANALEGTAQFKVRAAGTLANLAADVSTNTRDGAVTIRSRKNTANGGLVVSVTASTTGFFEDTSNSDTLAVDDITNVSIIAAGTTGTCTLRSIKASYTTTTSKAQYVGGTLLMTIAQGATRYNAPTFADLSTTEANAQTQLNLAFTASDLSARVQTNTASTTSTIKTRVNGADGTQAISIATTVTGYFVDATHSESVGASDKINIVIDVPAGTGSLVLASFGFVAETSAAGQPTMRRWGGIPHMTPGPRKFGRSW